MRAACRDRRVAGFTMLEMVVVTSVFGVLSTPRHGECSAY